MLTTTVAGRTWNFSHSIGRAAAAGNGFLQPVAVASAPGGVLYVLSRGNEGTGGVVSPNKRIGKWTIDQEFLGDFGRHEFTWPVDLAVDRDGSVYCSDEYENLILVYSADGDRLGQWGETGSGEGQFDGPSGLAFDADDNLYVVERDSNRVHKLTPDGETILTWGEEGDGEGQFDMPWGVAIDSEGFVYVADWRNDRIQKFTPEGEFCASFGESGTGEGQFHRPSSVAVDARGTIYITDWGNERVQVLGPDGEFKQMLRGEATLSKWAEQWLDVNRDELSARNGSDLRIEHLPQHLRTPYQIGAQTEHLFWGPVSAKLDGEHRLYVSEHSRARIQIYATN